MDKLTIYKKTDDFRVAAPKSVLDAVEIKSIDENGIFEVGKSNQPLKQPQRVRKYPLQKRKLRKSTLTKKKDILGRNIKKI